MADVTRFIPKAERLKADQVAEVRQLVLALGLPQGATDDLLVTLQRHETGGTLADWTFNMISPQQCLAVWNATEELPAKDRPWTVRRVFDYVLTHIETNTGIVTLTREELADKVGVRPQEVSSAMKVLERMGVVVRERVKVAGMRGPGKARYRLNPHVGWNGKLERREVAAQQASLPLQVIEGGKDAN